MAIEFLALAAVIYEVAKTYPPESTQFKMKMNEAAKKYAVLYEKYGTRLVAGLYARMWEGRCYKELEDDKKAFAVFKELFELGGESPAERKLKNKTMVLAMETALLPKVRKYKEAVASFERWQSKARGEDVETQP